MNQNLSKITRLPQGAHLPEFRPYKANVQVAMAACSTQKIILNNKTLIIF